MTASGCALNPPLDPVPVRSTVFLPPGRPRSVARRLAIHNRVLGRIRHFLTERGFQEVPVHAGDVRGQLDAMVSAGFPAVWGETNGQGPEPRETQNSLPRFKLITAVGTGLDLDDLGDLMEALLKDVTGSLGAELLGGRHVTRLDRTLHAPHPRLRHSEAVAAVGVRGWDVAPHEDLPLQVEAALVRHCSNLPVLVTHWPAGLKNGLADAAPGVAARVKYLVPYAGEVMDGGSWSGKPDRAGFALGVDRLLQYLMGLGSVADTRIMPAAKVADQALA